MKKQIFYISGTHWDREWYQTYQGFRLRLVKAVDEVLRVLEEHPEFPAFHFDGQTIAVEDYLEIHPENRERLRKLICEGRLIIGPWYCMPDDFLVSGEALIRNFQKGDRICRSWGVEPWKCGYSCDIFGHIAQMPQILRGVHIGTAAVSRGTNEHNTTPFFRWQSPDGSEVLTYKMPEASGYGAFAMEVAGQLACGETRDPEDPAFEGLARAYLDEELARCPEIPVAMVMDAMDHEPIHEKALAYLRKLQELYPAYEFRISNFLDAFHAAAPYRDKMAVKRGELCETACRNDGPHLMLLSHTLSSRYEHKKRNDSCQTLLERWLEPMNCLYARAGQAYHARYLELAWQYLLQNQPHDSICGCSIDRVHQEMFYRYSQVESIYEALMDEAETKLAGGRFLLSAHGGRDRVSVIHPLPYACRRAVTLTLPFETDYPFWQEPFGYQPVLAFRLYDEGGREVPYTINRILRNGCFRVAGERTAAAHLYTITCLMDLAPAGITELRVVPQEKPVRFLGGMADYSGTLENDLLRVSVEQDGSLCLTDRKTRKTYRRLCSLYDGGEIGDGWNSVSPAVDRVSVRSVLRSVEITANSPVYSEMKITTELWVPEQMEYAAADTSRSAEMTPLICEMTVSLHCEQRGVSVSLTVHNDARDHKLRLRIPTGIAGGTYEASQTFTFVKRPCGIDMDTDQWKEKSCLEKNMAGIVEKRDEDGTGLAFVSGGGLHECGADSDPEGCLYITLLRAMGHTVTTNGEPDGQLPGAHTYTFELLPLDAAVDNVQLQKEQDQMKTGVRSFVSDGVRLPKLLEVRGEICTSAMKQAADGSGDVIVRLYNPTGVSGSCEILVAEEQTALCTTDLLEQPAEQLPIQNRQAQLTVEPYKIVTLRLHQLT